MTSTTKPIIVLLGAGLNTGLAVAKKFYSAGWKVVCVARTKKEEFKPYETLFVKADFFRPETLKTAFEKIEAEVGIASVITYNAYAATFGENPDDLFASISIEDYSKDLQVNATTNFAAMKIAIAGFKKLPVDAPKTYILIGNMSSGLIVPETLTLGAGKNASLYTVESAAASYGALAKWYVADERDAGGNSTMNKISGEAHAEVFWDLVNDKVQHEVNYTFVKGKGYVKFGEEVSRPVAHVADLMEQAAKASQT